MRLLQLAHIQKLDIIPKMVHEAIFQIMQSQEL